MSTGTAFEHVRPAWDSYAEVLAANIRAARWRTHDVGRRKAIPQMTSTRGRRKDAVAATRQAEKCVRCRKRTGREHVAGVGVLCGKCSSTLKRLGGDTGSKR
jgi:hypothetical protein